MLTGVIFKGFKVFERPKEVKVELSADTSRAAAAVQRIRDAAERTVEAFKSAGVSFGHAGGVVGQDGAPPIFPKATTGYKAEHTESGPCPGLTAEIRKKPWLIPPDAMKILRAVNKMPSKRAVLLHTEIGSVNGLEKDNLLSLHTTDDGLSYYKITPTGEQFLFIADQEDRKKAERLIPSGGVHFNEPPPELSERAKHDLHNKIYATFKFPEGMDPEEWKKQFERLWAGHTGNLEPGDRLPLPDETIEILKRMHESLDGDIRAMTGRPETNAVYLSEFKKRLAALTDVLRRAGQRGY